MKAKPKRLWPRVLGIVFGILLVAGTVLFFTVRRHIPPGLTKDIRAGLAARSIADPDERLKKYLEMRYGALSDPATRQKVFLDYFNPEHIKALHFLVEHAPESQRQSGILAAARWVESYRNSLSAQERAALKQQLQSTEGQAMLKRATAQYNSQDVQYRAQTAPVISQLLNTISSLQTP